MALHDPLAVVTKSVVEGRLVALENLVDPQLLDAAERTDSLGRRGRREEDRQKPGCGHGAPIAMHRD